MKKQLILLHGALGCKEDFDSLAPLLTADFEVFSFNFSGHGQHSFSSEGFGIEVFSRELETFIQENALVKPSIFGYSMGGYVALYLASLNKNTLGKILTLGTKFEWTPENARHETSRMNPEVMEAKIPAFTNALANAHGKDWKKLVHLTAGMMTRLGESPLLNPETLSSVEVPVTIYRGTQDDMVSEEESKMAASQISTGQFFPLANAPHPIKKVDQGSLLTVIKDHL